MARLYVREITRDMLELKGSVEITISLNAYLGAPMMEQQKNQNFIKTHRLMVPCTYTNIST